MKYSKTLTCPVCKDGEVTVKVQTWPGSYYDQPEYELEVESQTCGCDLEDSYEALCRMDDGPDQPEWDGDD